MVAKEFCINVNGYNPIYKFSEGFETVLLSKYNANQFSDIAIVCIGTDRSTGDSLGPLVGHKLKLVSKGIVKVFGTLENPIHAKNLGETIKQIFDQYKAPYIIGIDACLGRAEKVGYISIGTGSIKPGAGVNKNLPEVGDMYVKGIVNVGGFMEYLVLQNTRLNLVMKMADVISTGIRYVLWKNIFKTEESMSDWKEFVEFPPRFYP